MLVEMKAGERELLSEMLGGSLTPECVKFYSQIRRRCLLVGDNNDFPKYMLAMIAELSVAAANYVPNEREPQLIVEDEPERDPTPIEQVSENEKETLAAQNEELNPDAAGGAYKGHRIKWETDFKSTPRTAIHKLEKGRPINYKSPNDGKWRPGRFVRINSTDKKYANVMSSEMKKAFRVSINDIEVTDLSRPSTEPLAVQI